MAYEPRFAVTAIGSLPHKAPEDACRLILDTLPEMPAWPQLPRMGFFENMYVQYSEGFPAIRMEAERGRMWVQTDELAGELEGFYQAVIDEELDHFAVSKEYAHGLDLFLSGAFSAELEGRPFLKGQVTGPISWGLTVQDENRRATLYNEEIEQVIVKGLTLKARWQVRELKRIAPGSRIVMFFDEPYLMSVGSALLSVQPEQVRDDISECVRGCGADLVGVHVCGKTDWPVVFAAGVDLVNFDAYNYMEPFIGYAGEIGEYLGRGGLIAWGIVPNFDPELLVTAGELADALESAFDTLESRGVDRGTLAARSLVTPTCGMEGATVELAERVLATTAEVGRIMRERYF